MLDYTLTNNADKAGAFIVATNAPPKVPPIETALITTITSVSPVTC